MKKSYLLFVLLVFACILESCQKESPVEQPKAVIPLSAQQELANLSPPIILFQYSLVNLATGTESGWIIDRAGAIKKYQSQTILHMPTAENSAWTETELIELYLLAKEDVSSITVEELLPRAYQGKSLDKKFLSGTETNNDITWVAAFYAFTQDGGAGDYGSCNNTSANAPDKTINQLIINLSGQLNRYETSTYAIDLHQWLLALKEKI